MKKISYALGLGIGQQLKSMNIEGFSIEEFSRSITEVMEGRPTEMTAREAQVMLNDYFSRQQEAQAGKAKEEGKKGTFDAREMVFLVKWSGVSRMSDDGKTVIDEACERQFYLYLQEQYRGDYLFPSWQAVCRERRFFYKQNVSMEWMAQQFAKHIPHDGEVA